MSIVKISKIWIFVLSKNIMTHQWRQTFLPRKLAQHSLHWWIFIEDSMHFPWGQYHLVNSLMIVQNSARHFITDCHEQVVGESGLCITAFVFVLLKSSSRRPLVGGTEKMHFMDWWTPNHRNVHSPRMAVPRFRWIHSVVPGITLHVGSMCKILSRVTQWFLVRLLEIFAALSYLRPFEIWMKEIDPRDFVQIDSVSTPTLHFTWWYFLK